VSLKKITFSCLFLIGTILIYSFCSGAPLMVDKNLFAQDRKPPPPESANAPTQPGKPGMAVANIQLDGIMFNGDSKKALVRIKGGQPGGDKKRGQSPFVTVREGQQLGDFRVVKIDPKSILIEKEGQSYTVNLFAEGKVASPVTPQAPPVNAAVNPAPVPGVAENAPPVPVPPNQRANVQPRPVPGVPGQVPQQIPPANVAVDPAQQVPGQVDANAAVQQQPVPEENEEE
jgi:hypothetical protein